MLSPFTLEILAQIGNVTSQDYVDAYNLAMQRRCKKLHQLHALLDAPWYDRLFYAKRINTLITDIHREQQYIDECRVNIKWDRVSEETKALAYFYEAKENELLVVTGLLKALKLK